MKKSLDVFNETKQRLKAYEYAMWVLSWDQETQTPINSFDYRTKQIEVLTNEIYQIESSEEYRVSIDLLFAFKDKLDPLTAAEVKIAYKKLRLIQSVPKKEYIDYNVLLSHSHNVWQEAKEKSDFELFLPTLEKIIEYNQKLTRYLQTETLQGYDVLLDLYEEGFTTKEYDALFDILAKELVPFVIKVAAIIPQITKKLTKNKFDVKKQKEFNEYLLDAVKFDRSRGLMKESAHPFTTAVSSSDVRITTRYLPNSIESAIFSTLHELGHAIYDQNVDPKYLGTYVDGGASLGIHESQSRLYENMIGRSYAFWEVHYEKLAQIFAKELKGVSLLDFYLYMNRVERTLIRTDADELTYPLHIMVRYEIEKELFNGKLKVKDLPKRWRSLYQEYVGVRPKNDADGVLQDIHWATGLFGYFPTYALGSAYAAQIYHKMNQDFNVENAISDNNIEKINNWLKERIHKFGATKAPKELILHATGEEFNPQYYIQYLRNKFSY